MKKIIKLLVKNISKALFTLLNLNKAGQYFSENFVKFNLNKKQSIKYNNINLSFYSPNRLNHFRVETFSTKEPETLEWIDKFSEKSVFWDIGANIGLYSCYAAKRGNCHVYSFEPSVFNLEILAKNININGLNEKISIVPLPLTNVTKETEFNMSSTEWGGAVSTFGEKYIYDGTKINQKFNYKMIGLSMDECIDKLKIKRPDYIKIDVDGIEHLILEGGKMTLQNAKSILIEVDENFSKQVEKTKEYFTNTGFTLKKKVHSKMIKESKINSVFNQIWEKV